MVTVVSSTTCGHTRTMAELPKIAAILQLTVERDTQPWFIGSLFDIEHYVMVN